MKVFMSKPVGFAGAIVESVSRTQKTDGRTLELIKPDYDKIWS